MSKIRKANSDIQIPPDLPIVKVGGIDYTKDYWMRGFLASRIGDLVVLQWATPDSSSCAGGSSVGEGYRDSLQETLENADIKIDDLRGIVSGQKTINSVFGPNSGVDMEDVRRLVEYLDNQTNSCWLILDA